MILPYCGEEYNESFEAFITFTRRQEQIKDIFSPALTGLFFFSSIRFPVFLLFHPVKFSLGHTHNSITCNWCGGGGETPNPLVRELTGPIYKGSQHSPPPGAGGVLQRFRGPDGV